MNDNWISGKAKLVYSPDRQGLRKKRAAEDYWLIAEMRGDIAKYYRWWVKKALYLDLQLPAWRPHITILDGRRVIPDDKQNLWRKYDGEIIPFEYNVNVEQHWKFWTLPVRSQRLDEICRELGVANKKPHHITIGRMY